MDQRHGQEESADYRYGFQGQEDDPEVKGEGNSTNYKYRMHDPRIGRFFAVDPLCLKYPELTPYQFSSNSPIGMVEIEGLEGEWKNDIQNGMKEVAKLPIGTSVSVANEVFREYMNTVQPFRKMPDEAAIIILIGLDGLITGGSFTRTFVLLYGLHEVGSEMNATDAYHEDMANGNYESAAKNAQRMRDHGPGSTMIFVELAPVITTLSRLSFVQRIGKKVKSWFKQKETREIIGTNYDEIRPSQDWINREKVEEYKEIILSGKDTDPIDVYTYNGNKYIEDGHHRFVAYKELDVKPNIYEHSFGGPQGLKSWKHVEEVEKYIWD